MVWYPKSSEELAECSREFNIAGMPGCRGSTDATHIVMERCNYCLRQFHLGYKLHHIAYISRVPFLSRMPEDRTTTLDKKKQKVHTKMDTLCVKLMEEIWDSSYSGPKVWHHNNHGIIHEPTSSKRHLQRLEFHFTSTAWRVEETLRKKSSTPSCLLIRSLCLGQNNMARILVILLLHTSNPNLHRIKTNKLFWFKWSRMVNSVISTKLTSCSTLTSCIMNGWSTCRKELDVDD